jgi:hypothetical protein
MKLISQAKSLGFLTPIDLQALEPIWYKNISIRNVDDYPLNNQIKYLASLLPRQAKVFDLKVQDLEKGEVPCLPGWHLDSGPDKNTNYVLMTAGVSKTDFALLEVEVPYSSNMKIFCHNLNRVVKQPTNQLKDFEVVTYTNNTIHRGSAAVELGRRLLIRVND